MKTALILLVCLATSAYAQVFARAILEPVNGSGVRGYVLFSQVPGSTNVTVTAVVNNITSGADAEHGIHVHWWGDITGVNAGALSVGGHWNPTAAPHACPPTASRHYGDMGNWVASGGMINETKTLDLLQLTGPDSIIGRAVIFHNLTDDCVTANTGNAGSRMATGVIGIINSTVLGGSGEANNSYGSVAVAGCKLEATQGYSVTGQVFLIQPVSTGPTTVIAMVNNITGPHGFHLHWWGDVSGPTGLATGAHFNPAGHMHGIPPVVMRHLGDMGIISFQDNLISYYNYTNDQISLNGLNNVIGRAIHVHLNSDDCVNPVGNGGARIAQCVIGIYNATAFVQPTFPDNVPTTQNGTAICATLPSSSTMSSMSSSTGTSMSSTSMSMSSTTMSSMSSSTTRASSTTSSEKSDAMSVGYSIACILVASVAMFF